VHSGDRAVIVTTVWIDSYAGRLSTVGPKHHELADTIAELYASAKGRGASASDFDAYDYVPFVNVEQTIADIGKFPCDVGRDLGSKLQTIRSSIGEWELSAFQSSPP